MQGRRQVETEAYNSSYDQAAALTIALMLPGITETKWRGKFWARWGDFGVRKRTRTAGKR